MARLFKSAGWEREASEVKVERARNNAWARMYSGRVGPEPEVPPLGHGAVRGGGGSRSEGHVRKIVREETKGERDK